MVSGSVANQSRLGRIASLLVFTFPPIIVTLRREASRIALRRIHITSQAPRVVRDLSWDRSEFGRNRSAFIDDGTVPSLKPGNDQLLGIVERQFEPAEQLNRIVVRSGRDQLAFDLIKGQPQSLHRVSAALTTPADSPVTSAPRESAGRRPMQLHRRKFGIELAMAVNPQQPLHERSMPLPGVASFTQQRGESGFHQLVAAFYGLVPLLFAEPVSQRCGQVVTDVRSRAVSQLGSAP